jgi:DNA mismatch repair protein MLH1
MSTAANATTIDRIRQIHGSAVANELIDFEITDQKWGFRASGLVTNANYHVKRTVILLFINHRSVESSAIRKAVEQTYSQFLPKGGHPFAYIDLGIEPHRVDVNIHPTKREVNFLNEEEIIDEICSEIRSKLAQVDSSRTFMTQSLLPGARPPEALGSTDIGGEGGKAARKTPMSASHRVYENNLVRTDAKLRKITSMLLPSPASQAQTGESQEGGGSSTNPMLDDGMMHYGKVDREPLRISLTSVKNLRAAVRAAMHNGLTEIFASHTYVGLVDERRRIAAIQSGVKLYLVDYGMVCHEFFYQIGLTDFGNFGLIRLDPPPKLIDLLKIAADIEREDHTRREKCPSTDPAPVPSSQDPNNTDGEDVFEQAPSLVAQALIGRRDMLEEYFSLEISPDGHVHSIPLLLKGYTPSFAKLPRFLLRLGPYVNWTSEEDCFRTFLRELAAFYTPEQLPSPPPSSHPPSALGASTPVEEEPQQEESGEGDREEDFAIRARRDQLARMLEHVVFPALGARLVATTRLLSGVVEVADLKGLYRVFERC